MTDPTLVLVNLGSTPSTEEADVRRYLNQFLMDRPVIDVPWPLRRFIVSMALRRRAAASAAAYRSIWWAEGSPLIVISQRLQQKTATLWGVPVELAMHYGEPSIEQVLVDLAWRARSGAGAAVPAIRSQRGHPRRRGSAARREAARACTAA